MVALLSGAAGGAKAADVDAARGVGSAAAGQIGAPRFCASLPEWKARFASDLRAAGEHPLPELVLDAEINGDPNLTQIQAVCLPDARLAVLAFDWRGLHLRPTTPVRLADGREIFPLESVVGLSYVVNTLTQTIDITVPAEAFGATQLEGQTKATAPTSPPPLGGYLSYDAALTAASGQGVSYGASLEGVVFGRFGLFDATGYLRGSADYVQFDRGSIFWELPFPGQMADLTVGDAIGGGGDWSRPVRFGGVRFSRDFDTNPGFITYPIPTIGGSAALPSTVELLINNQGRMTTQAPAGPFAITNVPIVTGGGQMQLVVTDLLGRQTVISQSYYVAPRLLSPGLSDFDFYAGFLRQNFGEAGDRYGDPVAVADYRRGLTGWLTTEVRGEAERGREAVGASALTRIGTLGAVETAVGYSFSREGFAGSTASESGAHYLVGFESHWPRWGFNVQWQYFAPGYSQFAELAGEAEPRQQISAGAGLQLGWGGSLTASYVYQSSYNEQTHEVVNAGWSKTFARKFNVGLSLGYDLLGHGWVAGFGLSVPLGRAITASANVTATNNGTVATAEATTGMPTGPGLGWRAQVSTAAEQTFAGHAIYNAPSTQLIGDVELSPSSAAVRVEAAGSIGMIGGYGFATRPIQSSFALVRTGDVAGAAIKLWNQPAAVTGANGTALITNLGAYQQNKISIDPADIPLDVEINATEVYARPWARAGVIANFPIRRTRSVLVVLRTPEGRAPPIGASVTVSPGGEQTRVADRGEVWLTDVADDNQLSVRWDHTSCQASLMVAPKTPPGAKLGPITCAAR